MFALSDICFGEEQIRVGHAVKAWWDDMALLIFHHYLMVLMGLENGTRSSSRSRNG